MSPLMPAGDDSFRREEKKAAGEFSRPNEQQLHPDPARSNGVDVAGDAWQLRNGPPVAAHRPGVSPGVTFARLEATSFVDRHNFRRAEMKQQERICRRLRLFASRCAIRVPSCLLPVSDSDGSCCPLSTLSRSGPATASSQGVVLGRGSGTSMEWRDETEQGWVSGNGSRVCACRRWFPNSSPTASRPLRSVRRWCKRQTFGRHRERGTLGVGCQHAARPPNGCGTSETVERSADHEAVQRSCFDRNTATRRPQGHVPSAVLSSRSSLQPALDFVPTPDLRRRHLTCY